MFGLFQISISERLIKSFRVSNDLLDGEEGRAPGVATGQQAVAELIDHSPPLEQLLSVVDSSELLTSAAPADKTIDEENEESNGNGSDGQKKSEKPKGTHAGRRLIESVSSEPLFQRENVPPSSSLVSRSSGLLSSQLTESSFLRQSRVFNPNSTQLIEDSSSGSTLLIFPIPEEKPLKIRLTGPLLVSKVIELCLQQWKSEEREPGLQYSDWSAYQLLMVDDDEGNPDEDMPPLDYGKDIQIYGVDAVAMVEKEDYEPASIENSKLNQRGDFRASISLNQRQSTIGSIVAPTAISNLHSPALALSSDSRSSLHSRSVTSIVSSAPKLFVKVFTAAHESVILNPSRDAPLPDLLILVCKKKGLQLAVEDCKFTYLDTIKFPGEIKWDSTVADLKTDEIRLIVNSESGSASAASVASLSSSLVHSSPINLDTEFQFTLDTAGAYSEYKVIKTNERGKRQTRIFGIDRHKIYNKQLRTDSSSAKSALKSAFSFAVQTADRSITSITSITMGEGYRANHFTISYRDKGKVFSREYETETTMECAEIVAKIRFLIHYSAL